MYRAASFKSNVKVEHNLTEPDSNTTPCNTRRGPCSCINCIYSALNTNRHGLTFAPICTRDTRHTSVQACISLHLASAYIGWIVLRGSCNRFCIKMVLSNAQFILLISLSLLSVHTSVGENKYSAEANKAKNADSSQLPTSLRDLDKPFRMAKLNVLWVKAKNRLTDTKLQSIFSDLKIHDKEEIAYKHFKSDGKDPDGLEEARLRQKLIGIMSTYGLLEHFAETEDPKLLKMHKALNDGSNYVAKDVFKDIRLNKLWAKAEMAGFTDEELETLKQEFHHHQEKVDEYTSLLKEESKDAEKAENVLHLKPESWNELEEQEEFSNNIPNQKLNHMEKANLLREKHLELRNGFDRLDRLTAKGPNHKEFVEPKVQGLWKIALEAKFSPEELSSLKEELLHYESRLLKLRHLHAEGALEAAQKGQLHDLENSTAEQHIKKHVRTVQKLHMDIESKIMQRHTEF